MAIEFFHNHPSAAIGALLIVIGIVAYFEAVDVETAIPGNLLFLVGVILVTKNIPHPLASTLLQLACIGLVAIIMYLAWSWWRYFAEKKKRTNEPGSGTQS